MEEATLPEARVGRLAAGRAGLWPLGGGRPVRDAVGLLRLSCRVALPSSTWFTCGCAGKEGRRACYGNQQV